MDQREIDEARQWHTRAIIKYYVKNAFKGIEQVLCELWEEGSAGW